LGPWAPRHCRGCRWLVTPLEGRGRGVERDGRRGKDEKKKRRKGEKKKKRSWKGRERGAQIR